MMWRSKLVGGFLIVWLAVAAPAVTAIVLCNLGSIAPAGLAERVAEVYLGDKMQSAARAGRRP